MVIRELSQQECRDVLARVSVARLGCAQDNQPYVVPVYFAYDTDYLYVLTTLGQKVEWMRSNPKTCVEVDEILGEARWSSVIANGSYQELCVPQHEEELKHARKLLAQRYTWWQNAMSERQLKSGNELIAPLFFRIKIDSITGLTAHPDG
jgi:uncharacterized protein